MPARAPTGFFIRDLVDGLVGEGWREQAAEAAPRFVDADRWVHPRLLQPQVAKEIRAEFHDGGRVLHVFLNDALQSAVAERIHSALLAARFTRHHHQPYALHVARPENQQPSELTAFMAWLGSEDGAAFHQWLSGWPDSGQRLRPRQVQTSRMLSGEFFPEHHDTEDQGLAVVYGFTRPWAPEHGGVLAFPKPTGSGDELRVPVRFNSVILFRPKNAPHRVEQVTPSAGELARFTVTAFYLAES